MYCISTTIRGTQPIDSHRILGDYVLYDSCTNLEICVDYSVFLFLRRINTSFVVEKEKLYSIAKKYVFKNVQLVDYLIDNKVIVASKEKKYNPNLLLPKKIRYPLTKLAIELTNACNLHCIHCYGKFGKNVNVTYRHFSEISNIKPILDKLHTKSIALTGGEAFLNKDFEKIALYLLQNGFKLTIFTNGYNVEKLKSFLEKTTQYHFFISVSLDGPEECHNYIRGREDAFEKTIYSLSLMAKYKNVAVGISTTIMNCNVAEIRDFADYIKKTYPNVKHSLGLVIPNDETKIEKSEFDWLYKKIPETFILPKMNKEEYRCRGGVTGASWGIDGGIKICTAAPNTDEFILGNVNDRTLDNIWIHPSGKCKKYRKEKVCMNQECKKCKIKCLLKNCRLMSYAYEHDTSKSNPLTCYCGKRSD